MSVEKEEDTIEKKIKRIIDLIDYIRTLKLDTTGCREVNDLHSSLLYKQAKLLIALYKIQSKEKEDKKIKETLEEIKSMIACLPPTSGGEKYIQANQDFIDT